MPSTPNYLWELEDLLGQGATASVYKARNKKSGEEVAVKVFNHTSYLRPFEVQMREFEMLGKLNHINIVKLFAVEETGSPKQKVLVMEYCSSGSLLSVLEEPENAFGLSESEFLIVVQCVVAGMNHLRENGIVHRDIKPGNIMRSLGEDGRSIYKLTDFGAARQLQDHETFISLYGTEEYLHPDMYERAVLRKPQQKVYGVTVDLWSIGVTFYHAACGSLPFIPYGGPRNNKEIMHKITAEKPPGAIAGVQRKENGPIEWISELPVTCRLSDGLRTQSKAILANILEADQEKCWGFDQFFAETNNILERMVIYVFSLPQARMHKIYIHHYNSVAIYMEMVAKQTGIAPERQTYFYEGHLYPVNPTLQVHHLPKTAEQYQFILIGGESEGPMGVIYKDPAFDFPRFLPSVDVPVDCSVAKNVVSAVYQTLRVTESLLTCQEFILRGTYWLIENLKAECRRMAEKKSAVMSYYNCMCSINSRSTRLYNAAYKESDKQDQGHCQKKLQLIRNTLSSCTHSPEKESKLGFLLLEVTKDQDHIRGDTSTDRLKHCLQKMKLIFKQFKKRKHHPRLLYNEEQIHKLDKINLGNLAKKVLIIFQAEVVQKYQAALSEHSSRIRTITEIRNHLGLVNGYLATCVQDLQSYEEALNNTVDRLAQRIQQTCLEQPNLSPISLYHGPEQQELTVGMLKLRDQMKSVSYELERNNSIIERLNAS
ncbi:inhibitor of nuclear factor kappa-B kinase subunit epsilon isoform X1 [Bufo bufo]|uniref:inhibitor of nuclear factor kappa-B kinase subunit epsilon isoform X1 n=2 Tax=Bufo bufo TaxID=8384 RepID=UPI001ABE5C66|nr:inhibitor of nuclear factor kappa-B kinase subunit epsilon isoform X1 [Bufo bufo]XP_040279889.1 inhibitor of nuclear factor kappa-B kinase subunit epsilon isoform X1 [Bufo bufo]XP_040279890.1 inhibitor of nuclear factor kappa-B kinase subunit epsilon isoform X1 [Bufo bufo]